MLRAKRVSGDEEAKGWKNNSERAGKEREEDPNGVGIAEEFFEANAEAAADEDEEEEDPLFPLVLLLVPAAASSVRGL